MATHSSVLAWRIPWAEPPGGLHTVHRVAKSQTRLKPLSMHKCMEFKQNSSFCVDILNKCIHISNFCVHKVINVSI